jgi:hypothetical protein
MVDNEPHAVVRLLLARMESHPEEFKVGDGPFLDRWYDSINTINAYGNETDKAALNVKLRDLRLGEAHEQVMDELLNGPERRRKEKEEVEYERKLAVLAAQKAQQQQLAAQQQMTQRYQNAMGQYQSQRGVYDADLDMYRNAQTLGLSGQSPMGTVATTGTLTNTINQIRGMLGAKK